MSQPSNKKPRLIELTAPDGYHYEGEPARIFNGSITKRLRKNIVPAQLREQMYSDLYCAICTPVSTEGAKDTLAFHCSICSEIVPNSLLAKLVRVYADKPVTTLEVEGDQDMWGETEVGTSDMIIAEEIRLLKQHMQKIKVRKPSVTAGAPATVEYFGGVERQQDINLFSFYSGIANQIPHIGAGIRKICRHSTATGSCERSFNIAGNVLNYY